MFVFYRKKGRIKQSNLTSHPGGEAADPIKTRLDQDRFRKHMHKGKMWLKTGIQSMKPFFKNQLNEIIVINVLERNSLVTYTSNIGHVHRGNEAL